MPSRLIHLRDVRRSPGKTKRRGRTFNAQPVICARDVLVLDEGSDTWAATPEMVTCSDCRERITIGAGEDYSVDFAQDASDRSFFNKT